MNTIFNLGLRTVAEGVETENVLNELKKMSCDVAQGYLISRPLSADDFLTYLKAGEWNVEHIRTDEETCDSY